MVTKKFLEKRSGHKRYLEKSTKNILEKRNGHKNILLKRCHKNSLKKCGEQKISKEKHKQYLEKRSGHKRYLEKSTKNIKKNIYREAQKISKNI